MPQLRHAVQVAGTTGHQTIPSESKGMSRVRGDVEMNAQEVDDYHELTNTELRIEIYHRVGVNPPGQVYYLDKPCLNSLVACLTGELPCVPGLLYDKSSPQKMDLKQMVADECNLGQWTADTQYGEDRSFKKRELTRILEHIDRDGDQRD